MDNTNSVAQQPERSTWEERSRKFLDTFTAAVVIVDVAGKITSINKRAEEMFGYDRKELLGQTIEILIPERYRQRHVADREIYFAEPQTRLANKNRDVTALRKDGSEFPVEIGLNYRVEDTSILVLAVINDITERKRAETEILKLNAELEQRVAERTEQLRESEEKFSTAFRSSPAAISIATLPDGRWIEVNDALSKMTGYTKEELLGHTSVELGLVDPVAREKIIRAIHAHGVVRDVEIQMRAKSGDMVDVLVSTEQIDLNGQRCTLTIQYDITALKRAEREIHRLNNDLAKRQIALETANKELEAFTYTVSHDLRAPLRAIDGFSRIVLEEHSADLPSETIRYLKLVRSNTQQMGHLIDDLLAFSRLSRQPLKKQLVRPDELVEKVLDELASEREGRRLKIVIGELPACDGDPALLKQVFMNLLSNALKYTRHCDHAWIEVGAQQNGELVYFVRDNGVGFDMQYAQKLFGVFQRMHRAEDYEGTGVGLAIVQRIIQRHGGRIWAESEVNKGATFYFTLKENVNG